MKLLALLPLAVLAADVAVASVVPAHHHRIARRLTRKKRCLARPQNAPPVTYPTSTPPPETTTTTDQPPPTSSTSPPPSYNPPQSDVLNVQSTCGPINAESRPSKTSGPNGSIFWLNCGIEDAGWKPPYFTIDQVIAKELDEVLSMQGNPYEHCQPYLDAFYQSGARHGIRPILLAAIAMKESSCRADITGQNGEQGLMQITPEKCPSDGRDCKEPYTNIEIGAQYLKKTLDECGGSLPRALGMYNGWEPDMTLAYATRQRDQNCHTQNNLDYLHQMFNGWMQGVNPRTQPEPMGVYFNLDSC
jgi:hypothetical protein